MKLFSFRPLIRDMVGELLYKTGLTKPAQEGNHYFTIVTFHRVLPENQLKSYPLAEIAVTPEELTWFIKVLVTYFICGPLAENLARWQNGEVTKRPLLAITFDDGQLDNFLHAKPILEAAGIRASFFVVVNSVEFNEMLWPDRLAYALSRSFEQDIKTTYQRLNQLGIATTAATSHQLILNVVEQAKTLTSTQRSGWLSLLEDAVGGPVCPTWDGMMSWKQLQELVQSGHEIGSHSMSHPILPQCSEDQLINEVNQSRQILQARLAIPVESFCYPNGNYDARTLTALQQAGYRQAVTTQWGPNKWGTSLFTLRRCDIQSQHSRSRTGHLSVSRLTWRLSRFHPPVH
ncbi:MAG: polysaccharide deacetylase family protein [Thioploca sp.]|nr:polysaccharide deacetylase family protein [Thioploca sp.]